MDRNPLTHAGFPHTYGPPSVDLRFQLDGLLLGDTDGAGDEAARRVLLAGDGQQRLREPSGVASLLAVPSLPPRLGRGRAGRVVLDGEVTVTGAEAQISRRDSSRSSSRRIRFLTSF